jgi:hypothetical protein
MSAEPIDINDDDDDDDAFAREFAKAKAENAANSKAKGPKRKRFTPDDHPADFGAAAERWWPSTAQYKTWWDFVLSRPGVDEDGWWWGHCPIHDKSKSPMHPTAQFHFKFGVARCWSDDPCWDKSSSTLTNLKDRLENKRGR